MTNLLIVLGLLITCTKFHFILGENIIEDNDEIYIEIEEIIYFFRKENKNILIDNIFIKSLISHFFSEISMENNFTWYFL